MRSIFLGAGFSKWAANTPLANSLFDFAIDATRLSDADEKRLALIEKEWLHWRSENPMRPAEEFIYWSMHKSTARGSRVTWYVSRRLSEPFITRIRGGWATLMVNDRLARNHAGAVKARSLLSLVMGYGLNGIITCNYDLLIEYALGTGGFNYGKYKELLTGRGKNPQFPWQTDPVRVLGRTPLAKLHGSLSWGEAQKFTDGKPGRAGNALIVPPAPEKTPPKELEDVWHLAAQILQDSSELVVFGFAFNPYDEALLTLLEENGKNLKRILIIDPFPKKKSARKLWVKSKIEYATNIEDVMSVTENWMQ